MKPTLSSVINNSSIPAKLLRSTCKQIGGFKEFAECAQNIAGYGAAGGSYGFISYSDTVSFTKRNKASILEYIQRTAQDIGYDSAFSMIARFLCLNDLDATDVAEAIYNHRSEYRTEVFNALAWFALEECARAYCDIVEDTE